MEVDIDLEVDEMAAAMVLNDYEWLRYPMAKMYRHLNEWLSTREDNLNTRIMAAAMWTAWIEVNR
jgi:hypothetical protein